jgi:hypothetical protein
VQPVNADDVFEWTSFADGTFRDDRARLQRFRHPVIIARSPRSLAVQRPEHLTIGEPLANEPEDSPARESARVASRRASRVAVGALLLLGLSRRDLHPHVPFQLELVGLRIEYRIVRRDNAFLDGKAYALHAQPGKCGG